MLLSFTTLKKTLTLHQITASDVNQLLLDITGFFAGHSSMSSANIQA